MSTELRHALPRPWKSEGITATTLLTLALGIGTTTNDSSTRASSIRSCRAARRLVGRCASATPATFRRPLLHVTLGVVVGTAIIVTAASLITYTEITVPESDLTLQGMAMIVGDGIVMLGLCMQGCVVPTRRALNIEPTVALRTE